VNGRPAALRPDFSSACAKRIGAVVLGGVALVAIARPAHGEPLASSLGWQQRAGAESCISEPELRSQVERRLGRALVPADRAALRVHGAIGPKAGAGWIATLSVDDGSGVAGVRDIETEESACSALSAAIVLAVVLAIDPDAALAPAPAPAEAPAPAPVARPAAPARDAAQPSPPRSSWRFGVGALGAVASGLLPGTGLGGRAIASLDHAFWSLELDATVLATGSTGDTSPRGEVDLALGGVAGCPLVLRRPGWGGSLCGGLELGVMSARGVGFDRDHRDSSWFVSPTLGLGTDVHLTGPFWATGRALLLVPVVRPDVVYEDADGNTRTLHRTSPVSCLLGLGLGVRFSS
jgi:hypothetical protein